ncbi:MAG: hypothetical protein JXR70_02645 [Spirochaetales bacterium]|nr:hypothetical protein [Spirochaetales bacterium]
MINIFKLFPKYFTALILLFLTATLFSAEIHIKAQLQSSIEDYEKNIYQNYRSIEFLEHKTERIEKNGKLDMEYSQTRRFTYDFNKKMLFVKVIDFKLLNGKNSKNIKIGDEKKERLKDFYGLASYFNGPWKNIESDSEHKRLRFDTNQWFFAFNCDIQLQKTKNFPQTIQAVTKDERLTITLNYQCHDDIYMLTQLSTSGSYQILFDKFVLHSSTIRDSFTINKR